MKPILKKQLSIYYEYRHFYSPEKQSTIENSFGIDNDEELETNVC